MYLHFQITTQITSLLREKNKQAFYYSQIPPDLNTLTLETVLH